jgi:ATP-dependent protease HslVU (ClpYQ) peptidase subunit
MTLCIGLKAEGHVYLGADRMVSVGGLVRRDGIKLVKVGDIIVAYAGSQTTQQFMMMDQIWFSKKPLNLKIDVDVHRLCVKLREIALDTGIKDDKGVAIVNGSASMLVAQGSELVAVENSWHRVLDEFYCIGAEISGPAAMHATKDLIHDPEERIKHCIKTVAYHVLGVGSDSEVFHT